MGRLVGSVAVITETREGIGRATALRFADEGAALVCVDADPAGWPSTTRTRGSASTASATAASTTRSCTPSSRSRRAGAGASTTGSELLVDGGQAAR